MRGSAARSRSACASRLSTRCRCSCARTRRRSAPAPSSAARRPSGRTTACSRESTSHGPVTVSPQPRGPGARGPRERQRGRDPRIFTLVCIAAVGLLPLQPGAGRPGRPRDEGHAWRGAPPRARSRSCGRPLRARDEGGGEEVARIGGALRAGGAGTHRRAGPPDRQPAQVPAREPRLRHRGERLRLRRRLRRGTGAGEPGSAHPDPGRGQRALPLHERRLWTTWSGAQARTPTTPPPGWRSSRRARRTTTCSPPARQRCAPAG